ncbi:MAG TPA: gliding motility-associated C-terminal domain-containing protein, partial [Bacteroidales bacterium]
TISYTLSGITAGTGSDLNGIAFNVGTTTITWTITDASTNSSSCSFAVTVNDNQNPTITAPADITVNTDPALHVATGVILGTPVTADNCGVASVINDAPAAFPAGTTIVTWTVTDIHGNTATAAQSVTAIDNQPPVITSVTSVSVPENTTSVVTVTATDPDSGDILSYSLSGGTDVSKFIIDSATGALSFIAPPDYEIPTDANKDSIYEVDITVKDQGGLTDVKTISVRVLNANDPPTDILLSKSSVDEHLPSGTNVGALTTIDEDAGDTHTYTLSGTDATFFSISGDTLKTNATFDYLVRPSYSIVIRTTDSQGAYYDKTFVITINNINEPPVILNTAGASTDTLNFDVLENETTQICLHVTDPDNDATSISELHSINGAGTLSIDQSSKTCFNYTPANGFLGAEIVFAKVCDNGVPSMCDSVQINVNVIPRFIFSQVISPNGDGANDTWVIKGLERYPDNRVTIFSRWGDVVYKARGYDNVTVFWNGDYNNGQSSKGAVPDGTYFYIIELGNGSKLTGFIVLSR